MRSTELLVLDAIPKDPVGKIDKDALRSGYACPAGMSLLSYTQLLASGHTQAACLRDRSPPDLPGHPQRPPGNQRPDDAESWLT
ncbi:hypothetical protein FRACA_470038 [Frankia canadensis]|uniref:Uncharacterized protein n=1 Tax=Frankia canadensis TaxID=1836972 RepID=A0A2I2KXV9_9ACTN|nr:hypothetical protein FRACA_470038 [Frankia canadensis]SOU57780.1 hypothetical protein FRACA_470038 [Frankia canadensis]